MKKVLVITLLVLSVGSVALSGCNKTKVEPAATMEAPTAAPADAAAPMAPAK